MGPIQIIAVALAFFKQYYLLVLILILISWIVKERLFSPLAKLPGPWLAGVSKGWFIWHGLRGKQHKVHLQCHEKYGPIWRAMPNYVLINDPKHMQKVYKWDRTDWYSAFNVKDTYVGVAATKSMEAHNWKRKRIGAAVSELPIIKPYINWPLVFHDFSAANGGPNGRAYY